MNLKLNRQLIINLLKKEWVVIILIIILAYVLRILPYLLGYPLPFTEDSIRDFQQVKYLVDHGSIDLNNSYYDYGVFPILHLLVYGISLLGFNPLRIFLFIPQIFPSLGILFFYFFLKKYFPQKISLLACFLIAVFGPHIHWSSQPVRETMGLFFFPLIIYLFDREINNQDFKTKINGLINKASLFVSMILMIFSHHWSTLMLLGWMLFYSLFFLKNKKSLFHASIIMGIFSIFALGYWFFYFPIALKLIVAPFQSISLIIQLVVGLICLSGLLLLKKSDLNKIKNNWWRFIFFFSTLGVVFFWGNKIIPLHYPFQLWLMFFIFFIFVFVGFFYTQDKKINNFVIINIFYLPFWLIAITYIFQQKKLYSMPFDPFRTLEYVIFALAPVMATGFLLLNKLRTLELSSSIRAPLIENKSFILNKKINIRFLAPLLMMVLIFLATLTYPPIFIYKHSFANTIFYDIRSNIRYIPPGVFELIKWANDHGYNVESTTPEVRSYQATFYSIKKDNVAMVTAYDQIIGENYNYINDPILRVIDPRIFIDSNKIKEEDIIYTNKTGFLVKSPMTAQFISQEIPTKLTIGQIATASITLKNNGTQIWSSEEYKLGAQNPMDNNTWRRPRVRLEDGELIKPGESVNFIFEITAPNSPGIYNFQWQMVREYVSWFGDFTPNVKINVTKANE